MTAGLGGNSFLVSEETCYHPAVGYQTKNIGEGFNYYCNTFVPCDKTKATIKISDIAVDSSVFMSSSIDFLTKDGANVHIDDPDLGKTVESYCYWDAEYTEAGVAGWYLYEDSDAAYPRNDRVIALGEAYCVSCSDGEEGAAMRYNGAVSDESTPFAIGEGFNYLGNCAPADIKISDITVDSSVFLSSSIDFLTKVGSNVYIDDPDLGKTVESYCYWDAEYTEAGVAGWYLYEDSDAAYPRNDRVIKAGDAFCVSCSDGEEGATFTLPSAL